MTPPDFPVFRFHADPVASGSVTPAATICRCCRLARGWTYTGPVYAEAGDLDDVLCPWCIADGSAHRQFVAEFIDSEALPADTTPADAAELTQRTPGFATWQAETWPGCCGSPTVFLGPMGLAEIRRDHRAAEMVVLNHIIYDRQISGGAALRLLRALDREQGPTAYLFHCPRCAAYHAQVDQP